MLAGLLLLQAVLALYLRRPVLDLDSQEPRLGLVLMEVAVASLFEVEPHLRHLE